MVFCTLYHCGTYIFFFISLFPHEAYVDVFLYCEYLFSAVIYGCDILKTLFYYVSVIVRNWQILKDTNIVLKAFHNQ